MTETVATKQVETQVAWAMVRVNKPFFTYGELQTRFVSIPFQDLRDWTAVFDDFVKRGFLEKQGEQYTLTTAGKEYTDKLRSDDFGEGLIKLDQSQAYNHFCDLLYGTNLGQYNMTTMEQLDKLIQVLKLDHNNQVLDLGCGVGRITEYLSDLTGASITGLDFAEPAVKGAQERTRDKAACLKFVVGTMNQLNLPTASFDTVIAIDTLYFATDLAKTIGQLKAVLSIPGQMGLLWSQMVPNLEAVEQLQPNKTRLAQALIANELTYQTYDFTAAEKQFWQHRTEVLLDLKAEFEAEDNLKLYDEEMKVNQTSLEMVNSDRISRYLYHVQVL